MRFESIPGRVFLDTNVVNFILDHGEQIHDGVPPPRQLSERAVRDVHALYNLFLTGQRAAWQLAVSPDTYQEIVQTKDLHRKNTLNSWFGEICDRIEGQVLQLHIACRLLFPPHREGVVGALNSGSRPLFTVL